MKKNKKKIKKKKNTDQTLKEINYKQYIKIKKKKKKKSTTFGNFK